MIGYAALYAAKAGLKILKGVVETTDPAIMQAKKIQEGLVAAASSPMLSQVISAATQAADKEADSKEGLKGATDFLGSEAFLATIVFTTITPFPFGPNVVTPITPYGITYLAQATAFEAAENSGADLGALKTSE